MSIGLRCWLEGAGISGKPGGTVGAIRGGMERGEALCEVVWASLSTVWN